MKTSTESQSQTKRDETYDSEDVTQKRVFEPKKQQQQKQQQEQQQEQTKKPS